MRRTTAMINSSSSSNDTVRNDVCWRAQTKWRQFVWVKEYLGRCDIVNAHESCKQVAKFKYFVSNNYAYKHYLFLGENQCFHFNFQTKTHGTVLVWKLIKKDLIFAWIIEKLHSPKKNLREKENYSKHFRSDDIKNAQFHFVCVMFHRLSNC